MEHNYTPLNPLQTLILHLQAEEWSNGSDRVALELKDLFIKGMEDITPEQLAEKIHLIYYKEMAYLINR